MPLILSMNGRFAQFLEKLLTQSNLALRSTLQRDRIRRKNTSPRLLLLSHAVECYRIRQSSSRDEWSKYIWDALLIHSVRLEKGYGHDEARELGKECGSTLPN